MDKNAIKKYAVWARNELITRVTQKAEQYEITEKKTTPKDADSINGRLLTDAEKNQRKALIEKIQADGFEQVMEEVAYTWFNRFTALRFMEVNNYLPSHTRVFTNEAGEFKPQILTDAIQLELDGLDMDKVFELKDANKTEELYKYLLITQCNTLSTILPGMFQKIEDYTELLLPDYLLREGSVIEQMISMIPEDNFDVNTEGGQVEIIGWLYQYYNDEKKNEVININKGVVNKNDIPAATQLFTTDWVVKYIIDNSIGRYWIERNTGSQLKDHLQFYVYDNEKYIDEKIVPQDVTLFDPCMGSGHFLIYGIDVLVKIYVEYGYTERDAVAEVIKNNIFGLDIDDRAAQLAYFAVMMKGRQYDRRFFTRGIQPNVYAIYEINRRIDDNILDYLKSKKDCGVRLIDLFCDGKELGSIIKTNLTVAELSSLKDELIDLNSSGYTDLMDLSAKQTLNNELQPLIRQAILLSQKYAVVATNPPYLNKYDEKLKKYINKYYKDYSGDLYSVFVFRNFDFCKKGGYSGFMTPFVWMFIKTYGKLRDFIINNKEIVSLIQMEYSAFEEATVPICSFVLRNQIPEREGIYFRLSDFKGGMEIQKEKVLSALNNWNCGYVFKTFQKEFVKIPGSPIAYWASKNVFDSFDGTLIGEVATLCQGLTTTDNNKYVRNWQEPAFDNIGFGFSSTEAAKESGKRWFPFNKGGSFRKWYGNNELVVNYENDGESIKRDVLAKYTYLKTPDFVVKNSRYYFNEGLTWSALTSGNFSIRSFDAGAICADKGQGLFADEKTKIYSCALLNSKVATMYLKMVSPTLDYNCGYVRLIPYIFDENRYLEIERLTKDCIDIARWEWDVHETSWDFKRHPLIQECETIEEAYHSYCDSFEAKLKQLQVDEERINEIFIEIYSLQNEIDPSVFLKDLCIQKETKKEVVKSFISYAVGCMLGRYSLDEEGIIYAGGEWNISKYKSFPADNDGIIPICDDEYFEDDIVGSFIKFVRTVYGINALEDNLQFIADALTGKGTSREVIRNYFINDFYADHLKIYQKKPIYWLFDSGKKNGFKCLVYMHRYHSDTVARIRTDYVHEQQSRYRTAIAALEERIQGTTTSERVKLNKQLLKIQDQANEAREYEEKIHHLADQMISIDLDDGVKTNYGKFQSVLAKIK